MHRRAVLKLAAASALAGPWGIRVARAQDATVKVGVVGPRTGVMASGAAVTHFPNFKLWEHEVNSRGGLKLKGGQKKVELVEYDDRSQPGETIKAVERLAAQDKVDYIMPVYGTGYNLAAAPIFAKYGYPQVTQAAVTDQMDTLTQRYPLLFFVQGSTTSFASSAANVLKKLKEEGKIGNKVAIVNVADAFGIELANAGRPIFTQAGFDIVYDKSYPLGTQDLSPVMKAAKAANPDASTPDSSWLTIGPVFIDASSADRALRHEYTFDPVSGATALRIIAPGAGIGDGRAIDELEVYAIPEPGSAALILACGMLAGLRRRRR